MKEVKGLLLFTAAIIVIRIGLEETGIAPGIHNVLGVSWLLLIVPLYLGAKAAGEGSSLGTAAKNAVFYAAGTRFMVMLTYSLAWLANFSAPRFSVEGGGVVGEPSPLWGIVLTPAGNFLLSTVVTGLLGALLAVATAWVVGKLGSR